MKNYMILQIIGVAVLIIVFGLIADTQRSNREHDLERLARMEDELMLLGHSGDKDDNLCRFYQERYDEISELYKKTARELNLCQIRLAKCREK